MQAHGATLAADAERDRREHKRPATFREVAATWLIWLRDVRGGPSTLYGYDTLPREPGSPHRRGPGTNPGRILGAFGDMPAADITTRDITRFLCGLDAEGFTPRNVNRYCQVLHAVFNYGRRIDSFELPGNPVDEVEALARTCEAGRQRRAKIAAVDPAELAARGHEDRQDADGALAALARLADRNEFVGTDDYVVCNRWGRRLDGSTARRCGAAIGSAARRRDCGRSSSTGCVARRAASSRGRPTRVYVREFLGHAKLATTDRYVSAKHRPEDLERLNRAFAPQMDASAR